jgi:hypothetical protein
MIMNRNDLKRTVRMSDTIMLNILDKQQGID